MLLTHNISWIVMWTGIGVMDIVTAIWFGSIVVGG